MTNAALNELLANPEYKVLRHVPNHITPVMNHDPKLFIATVVDLETMGMDAKSHEIIEIGLLSFSFSSGDGIINVCDSCSEFNPNAVSSVKVLLITKIFLLPPKCLAIFTIFSLVKEYGASSKLL